MLVKSTVFAFVLEVKKSLFRKRISDQDLSAIRNVSDTPDADVLVIYPRDWKPPKINSFDAEEINSRMEDIIMKVYFWFAEHKVILTPVARNIKSVLLSKDGKKAFIIFKLT